jgi:hypothetical protein
MATSNGNIDDGHTRPFKIAARPGVHDELTGTYRVIHPDERLALRHPNMAPDMYAARCLALVVKNVKTWNRGSNITEATVRALDPNEFAELLDYILGYSSATADAAEKNS